MKHKNFFRYEFRNNFLEQFQFRIIDFLKRKMSFTYLFPLRRVEGVEILEIKGEDTWSKQHIYVQKNKCESVGV